MLSIRDLIFGPNTQAIPARRPLLRCCWPFDEEATHRLLVWAAIIVGVALFWTLVFACGHAIWLEQASWAQSASGSVN